MRIIKKTFLRQACDILGETENGLKGSYIVKRLSDYAVEFDLEIPYANTASEAPNKRTALFENIEKFTPQQQYYILCELCNHDSQKGRPEVIKLLTSLKQRYGELDTEGSAYDKALTEYTQHWLSAFPQSLELYNEAIEKRNSGLYNRNLLDDLRLSLELLLKSLLKNDKSMENQKKDLGNFIQAIGGSKEFTNMFIKLIEYYSKYQNEHIKHDDKVVEIEIDFLIDITSSFMKSICRFPLND